MATMLQAGRSGVRIPEGARDYSLLQNVQSGLGPTQPSNQWVPGFFPGVKRPDCEVDHSSSSIVEVKNEWSYTSTICLYVVDR